MTDRDEVAFLCRVSDFWMVSGVWTGAITALNGSFFDDWICGDVFTESTCSLAEITSVFPFGKF